MTGKSDAVRRGRPPAGAPSARDALLRSGATHFSHFGYTGASTRAILADAGASAPALYHHFGNKTGLYIAAAAAGQEHVLDVFAVAVADKETVADRAAALVDAAMRLRREHPNIAKYLSVIQQDVARHRDLGELLSYKSRFDAFWQHVTDGIEPAAGLALGLRAIIEGLLAVGAADIDAEEIASAAEALRQITADGLERFADQD